MIYNLAGMTGMFIALTALIGEAAGRIGKTVTYALMAVGSVLDGFACLALGHYGLGVFFAASAGLFVWLWWHSGGGDGTRRRLRAWAGRFHGVRRTAPAVAS